MGRVPRLLELVARNLAVSKTEARRLLAEGLVTDAGGATLADPRLDIAAGDLPLAIEVEGSPLSLYAEAHVMLNKPAGYITALQDDRYPTAHSLLSEAPLFAELRAVGRLDVETTGLLLWTTDGQWLQRLTHPKRAVPRTYQAALARPYRADFDGLTLEDGHRPNIRSLRPLAAEERHPSLLTPEGAAHLAEITVTGGSYHEVRRIFAALGSHVLGLCRVSFGPFTLPGDLPPGEYLPITPPDPEAAPGP